MARRGGKINLDELVLLTNQTEDYSTGDLVISSTTSGKFWAKVEDLAGDVSQRNPINDKHRDNNEIKLICRATEVKDVDLGSEITLSRDTSITYTVNDKYGGPDYKFYTTLVAYLTSN